MQVRLLPNVLNGKMTVSSVLVDGVNVEPIYSLENSLLRVPLDPALPPGESVDLSFKFSVTVPTEIETNYGILAYFNGVLTLAHSYPMIAVYDDEGWNAEIPPDQGDPTYADASFFLVQSMRRAIWCWSVRDGRSSARKTGTGRRSRSLRGRPAISTWPPARTTH